MRYVASKAMREPGRLLPKAVALAWRQRPSADPFGARAAATSPSGTFVNKPRVPSPPLNLPPSPRRHRFI